MKKQMKHIKPYVAFVTVFIIAFVGFVLFRYAGLISAEESRDNNAKIPVLCPNCSFEFIRDRLKNKNLNNAYMPFASFGSTQGGLADLSGSSFDNAFFNNVSFYGNLTNASFRNASLVDSTIDVSPAPSNKVDFRNADLTGATIVGNYQNANFSKANFTNANLSGVTGMPTANVSEATWVNTICPDGSNSDSSGNTCAGHF
jgi:uncharacterized protein YjbI with pentapeptide repeats